MFFKNNNINIPKRAGRGFTLIEVIVVMGVFLFIIGAAIGIFISVIDNQKKVLSQQQLINQVSYIEEYMSKSLRMAAVDTSGNCTVIGTSGEKYIYLLTRYDSAIIPPRFKGIRFLNQSLGTNGICQEFFIDNSNPAYPILKELRGDDDGNKALNDDNAVPITSSGLEMADFKFSINGSDGSTFGGCAGTSDSPCGASNADDIQRQPKVTMLFKIKIAGDAQEPYRTIQTTVSQRNLNVK